MHEQDDRHMDKVQAETDPAQCGQTGCSNQPGEVSCIVKLDKPANESALNNYVFS
jgi:hypothetical protein